MKLKDVHLAKHCGGLVVEDVGVVMWWKNFCERKLAMKKKYLSISMVGGWVWWGRSVARDRVWV